MSNSQDFSNRKRARNALEKSNFVHTCNLLSQFIKEKGSLRDLNFEIGDRVESLESIVKADKSQVAASTRTKSLTNMEKPVQGSTEQDTSMDPIPWRGMLGSSSNLQDASNKAVTRLYLTNSSTQSNENLQKRASVVDSKFIKKKEQTFRALFGRGYVMNEIFHELSREAVTMESKNAQLTIFYAGRVLVFDDYPPEKVTELAEFASKESSKEPEGRLSNHVREKVNLGTVTARERLPRRPEASASRKAKRVLPNSSKEEQERLPPRPEASGSLKAKGILLNSEIEKMNTGGAVASCSRPKEVLSPQLEASGSLNAKGILLNSEIEKMNTGGAVASRSRPKEVLSPQLEASGSDLPIARRSSLHRFLEKRKDRTVKELNQIQELQPAYSPKPDEQLELKL